MTNPPSIIARRCDAAAALLLALVSIFRLWYSATHGLVQDEAYYWQWSRHLAWGYYDNTPLIAPVIHSFTLLFGDTELGVRAGAVASSAVTSAFIYLIARRLCGAVVALASMTIAQCMPLFAIGSMLMTQDPLQLAFWSATLYFVLLALDGKGWLWLVAGVLAGLTVMAKFNGWLLAPSVLLFLLIEPNYRKKWLLRPEPYLAAVIAFLEFTPFLWWNHTHHNVFWHHIWSVGSRSAMHDGLKWFARFLGDQTVELSPLILLAFLYTLWTAPADKKPDTAKASLFLWTPAVTVVGSVAAVSLRSKVEGNWAAAAYVTGIILVARLLVDVWSSRRRRGRVFAVSALVLSVVLSAVALFPNLLYIAGVRLSNPRADRTNELYGWPAVAQRSQAELAAVGGRAFIFGANYRIPSEVSFYTAGHPATYCFTLYDRPTEYMFWQDTEHEHVGDNAVFMNDSDLVDHVSRLKCVFDRVVVQPPLLIYRNPPYGAKPIRIIQVYRCYGFKGFDQTSWQRGW